MHLIEIKERFEIIEERQRLMMSLLLSHYAAITGKHKLLGPPPYDDPFLEFERLFGDEGLP